MAVVTAGNAADPTQVRNAASSVTKRLEVQSRLPNDSANAEAAPNSANRWLRWSDRTFSIQGAAAAFDLITWVFIVMGVIALIAVLASVFREPLEARLRPALSAPVPLPDAPALADPRDLLARADQLAAAGEYAEAMHCVLLAATTILGRDKHSLTSWELLRQAALAPPRLDALRDLVIRTERAWFGHRPAGPDDYRRVRVSFDAFATELV